MVELLMDTIMRIMHEIRSQIREQVADMTMPQFRALGFLENHPGASLSDVAEHVDVGLPSMSRLVDGLVGRGLATREVAPNDRRRVTLVLTDLGRSTLYRAQEAAAAHMAARLDVLEPADREIVLRAILVLNPLFSQTVGADQIDE